MIEKTHREGDKNNLVVTDKNGNRFTMMVGGNLDLFWLPENYKQASTFYIPQEDEVFYQTLCRLFEDIAIKDDPYNPTLVGDTFTFISEDFHESEANRLKIVRGEGEFAIHFEKNDNVSMESFKRFSRGCPICFCNSGSRVPQIEVLFMLAFNDLAYYNPDIDYEME